MLYLYGERWNKTEAKETRDVVRGCEKRIYHVKNPDSEIFDEAYLVLRRQDKGKRMSPRDIENEAKRILSGVTGAGYTPQKSRDRRQLKAFLAGALMSAVIILTLSLVIWLLL
jgi:hypothetical protein